MESKEGTKERSADDKETTRKNRFKERERQEMKLKKCYWESIKRKKKKERKGLKLRGNKKKKICEKKKRRSKNFSTDFSVFLVQTVMKKLNALFPFYSIQSSSHLKQYEELSFHVLSSDSLVFQLVRESSSSIVTVFSFSRQPGKRFQCLLAFFLIRYISNCPKRLCNSSVQ